VPRQTASKKSEHAAYDWDEAADHARPDTRFALGRLAERFSTRSVRLARMILIQAIRNAMINDLVVRDVADPAAVPTGKPGRPSRSLNLTIW
jgi:hypothetical protein